MPSRASSSFLPEGRKMEVNSKGSVNALSGFILISTVAAEEDAGEGCTVSMPSRASSSFLLRNVVLNKNEKKCQCPLGLHPHFYVLSSFSIGCYTAVCQCPLGLHPHFYIGERRMYEKQYNVSMPSRASSSFLLTSIESLKKFQVLCQCPLGLHPHFYAPPQEILILCCSKPCENVDVPNKTG